MTSKLRCPSLMLSIFVLCGLTAGCSRMDRPQAQRSLPGPGTPELVGRTRPHHVFLESFWSGSLHDPTDVCVNPMESVAAHDTLECDRLIAEVLAGNPSLVSAEESWRAAMEVHPQVTSLNDPQFRFLNGPTLFGNNSGAHLWRLQIQQRVPWFGKRAMMGDAADFQAESSHQKYRSVQNQLRRLTAETFLDYALAERIYELGVAEHQLALEEQRIKWPQSDTLTTSFRGALNTPDADLPPPTGQVVSASVALQILELHQEREELEQMRQTAVRRVNALLKRDPLAPLPPPGRVDLVSELPDTEYLIVNALDHRPEAAAARADIRTALTDVELAHRDFYPDFEIVGRFDTNADQFWAPERANIRPQLGVNLYLPIQHERRWARVRQTEAMVRKARAGLKETENNIRREIREAVVELENLQKKREILDELVMAAERQVQQCEQGILLASGTQDSDTNVAMIKAQRSFLKHRMRQMTAEYECRQRLLKLHSLASLDWLSPSTSEN